MVYDDIKVSRETRRVPEDDQATLASFDEYGVRSEVSDEWTLPGDDDGDGHSLSDVSSVASYDSYDSYIHSAPLPSYRVPKEQSAKQPVYEAWTVYCSPDDKEVVTGTKICGVNVFEHYDQLYGHVNTRPIVRAQPELTGMYLEAIDDYQRANKRSLPSRIVRGRAKSYEQDLEERICKLPTPVQSEINSLLADREQSTSSRYHIRDWTVVLMQEQLRYRFTSAESQEVKRHKLRFWKNKDKKQPIEFFVVLRGEEINFPENDKGHFTQRRYGNPWSRVDQHERRARDRARDAKIFESDKLGGRRMRPRRRMSPPPVYRRSRARSITPPPVQRFPLATPCPPPPPPPNMAMPPYGGTRAPRPFVYNPVPPPPAPPLPRYPSYPPPPPMPYQSPPGLGPIYPPGPSPSGPGSFPIRTPYSQNLSYPPVWHSPPPPPPMPFVPATMHGVPISMPGRASYPPTMMHPAPPFSAPRPDFPPPPPPPMPMGLSPPSSSFPAPPPAPMPSNLTTPTFTATASERSVGSCTCARPDYVCGRMRNMSWTVPCAACKASRTVARSDADVSELAVEDDEAKEEKKNSTQSKGTDSGLGDEEEDSDRDDDQSLYD